MPPHLHPRSKLTSSLFATTLFASFFVVALPHLLPCPAPRIAYADGEMMPDGTRRRRRRRRCVEKDEEQPESSTEGSLLDESSEDDMTLDRVGKANRGECPIPKPGGIVGEILGFKDSSSGGKGARPP